jgi:radical SAM protein with 4Fe4S-binding SPASM domain
MNDEFVNLRNLCVYVGGHCNFNCKYCDRDFIKENFGYQKLTKDDIPRIKEFLSYVLDSTDNIKVINFHGGEPFLFISLIDELCEFLDKNYSHKNIKYFIQTNGSMILKNKGFIEKYKDKLIISISYDNLFQTENRTEIPIEEILSYFKEIKLQNVQLQPVLPLDNDMVFSYQYVYKLISLYKDYYPVVKNYNFLFLRYSWETEKIETLLGKKKPLEWFFGNFIKLLYALHLQNVGISLDSIKSLDQHKKYCDNHWQIIVAPDGYLYPEFAFIEHKVEKFRIGQWRDSIFVQRHKDINSILPSECDGCTIKDFCGYKYTVAAFNTKVPENKICKKYYELLSFTYNHYQEMLKCNNLFELFLRKNNE